LAAVKPDGLFLILELMHFASEILSTEVLKNGSATAVSDKELKMGAGANREHGSFLGTRKSIGTIQDALMEIIEQKAQNREIAAKAPAPPAPTNVVDLVKVLQDSLNRTQSLKQKRDPVHRAAEGRPAHWSNDDEQALGVSDQELGPVANHRCCIYSQHSLWPRLPGSIANERKRATVKKYAALRAELKSKKDYAGLCQLPRDAKSDACREPMRGYRPPGALLFAGFKMFV